MSTKAERNEASRSLDINGVKNMIKDGIKTSEVTSYIKNGSMDFKTPIGNINLSDDSIEYYHKLFSTSLQHAKTYEVYMVDLNSVINSNDPNKMCEKMKDIIDAINASEMYREKYSVIAQWLNDSSISKEDVSALYSAYGKNNVSGLKPELVSKFTESVKRTLWYYKVLFLLFELFDRTMFEGDEPQEALRNASSQMQGQ